MKKLLFKLLWVFILVFSLTFGCLIALDNKQSNVKATDVTNPKIEILKNNVSYSDSIYIAYAVSCEGFEINKNSVNLLFWNTTQENYLKGSEDALGTSKGKTNINGKQCLIFYSEGLAAKHMTDDLYSRAYVVVDGVEYYSEVVKFSVLEYVYKMKEEATLNPHQQRLFDTLLQYGGAAQDNFDYNTNKKADATYYKIAVNEGILPDGFKHGRYQLNEKVVIKPLSKPGQKFSHWLDQNGIIVSYDKEFEITVTDKNEYTAIYKDISNVSTQLKMEYEVEYDATAEDLDLPNAVSFDIDGETTTLDITWDLSKFVVNQIGVQKLYATLVDETAYEEYGISKEDIYCEVNVLPYTYELDQETGNYILTGYFGTDELVEIPSIYKNTYITKIAPKAFNEVLTLKEVVIPTTIEEIGLSAFYYCDNIEKMTIPFIGANSNNMTSDNKYLGYIFGATSYENQNDILPLKLTEIIISSGTSRVYSNAFYCCSRLEKVYIASTINMIGYSSFEGCNALEKVYYNGTIDQWMNINLLSNPKQYATSIYMKNQNDEYYEVMEIELPNNITEIGQNQFLGFKMTTITIPSSVTSIGDNAFGLCVNLENVYFESKNNLNYLGDYAFAGCSALSSIELPESIDVLNYGLFNGCESLTSIEIPTSVTQVKSDVFYNCISLKQVIFADSIIELDAGLFEGCVSLEKVTLPANITVINSRMFWDCYALNEVVIPDNVITIEDYAFYQCSSLTSINIPSKVRSIGECAFNANYNLENVYYDNTFEQWCNIEFFDNTANPMACGKHIYMKDNQNDYYEVIEIEIPSTLTSLGNKFTGFNMTSIVIPSTITEISDRAFYSCTSLTDVILNDDVTRIGDYAFYNCTSLTNINIPRKVTYIGGNAFSSCKSLETIYIPSSVVTIGAWAFTYSELLTIYCEAQEAPDTWAWNWNISNNPVVWGYVQN